MTMPSRNKKITVAFLCVLLVFGYFHYELAPVDAGLGKEVQFRVDPGAGFSAIVGQLSSEGLIRSEFAFKVFAVLLGSAAKLKPGLYALNQRMTGGEILDALVSGSKREVEVRILDGSSLVEVDRILSDAGVLPRGALLNFHSTSTPSLEGRLYPDTYRFFENSLTEDVVKKFLKNFSDKAVPILDKDALHVDENLVYASLVQKEVSDFEDARIVAGIFKKRIDSHIPLQVDATICYIKKQSRSFSGEGCYPLNSLDFKIDSPYNTYLYKGLPPGPIGSPGLEALRATLEFKSSPYWFYLSDPVTHKTIFSRTLEEQEANRAKYLRK